VDEKQTSLLFISSREAGMTDVSRQRNKVIGGQKRFYQADKCKKQYETNLKTLQDSESQKTKQIKAF